MSPVNSNKKAWPIFELQRQPVPPLEKTIDKYLESVKPLLNEKEFAKTCDLAWQLKCCDVGKKMQKLLEKRAAERENWLSDWWLDMGYLSFRVPVTLNVNPGLIWPAQSFKDQCDYVKYTSQVILGAIDFKNKIDK